MKLYDISVPIRPGMIVYEGNPEVSLERVESIADGAHANVSRLSLGAHTGTHVDAPLHFLEDGPGCESLELEPLIGPAVVVDALSVETDLDADTLRRLEIPAGAERVLLKTRNGRLWERGEFSRDFIRLTGSGARYVVERGISVIGIDFLSIGDEEAHRELLSAGVIPIEGLDLREVDAGPFQLICLPVRLEGSDGAPARAVLIRELTPAKEADHVRAHV
jgi:arylformamidase